MAPLLPSTRLYACPACHEHVKGDATACPHCGAELRGEGRFARAASTVLVGLALSGCPDKDTTTATSLEPEYGVATSGPMNTTSPGTDASTAASTGGTGSGGMTGPEPEYGVPSTSAEPDYGVPATTGSTSSASSSGSTGGSTSTVGEPEYGVPSTSTG